MPPFYGCFPRILSFGPLGAIHPVMREKLFDDLTGMVGGAAGLLADIRDQVRGDMRDRLRGVADRIDLVTRDELTALESRIAAIEALLTIHPSDDDAPAPKKAKAKKAAPKAAPAKKAAPKKAAPKKKGKK